MSGVENAYAYSISDLLTASSKPKRKNFYLGSQLLFALHPGRLHQVLCASRAYCFFVSMCYRLDMHLSRLTVCTRWSVGLDHRAADMQSACRPPVCMQGVIFALCITLLVLIRGVFSYTLYSSRKYVRTSYCKSIIFPQKRYLQSPRHETQHTQRFGLH